MAVLKLAYVLREVDRHGKVRFYFRKGKGKRIALPGTPGMSTFMEAYKAASFGLEKQSKTTGAGTFAKLVADYYKSPDYIGLAPSTRKTYRSVIDRWLETEKIGHRLVREMSRQHISRMISARAQTPGAANSLLQKIKVLVRFAIDSGVRADDPTLRLKKFKKGEFHTWTEDEIAQYEARWPVGTTARLAFALLLYTGQRRSDVVTMARTDVEEGMIQVQPQKTRRTTGARLWIPIHPELAVVLDQSELGQTMLLETTFKKAFAAAGFGNFMADRIAEAGLPDRCVTHGLRKAAARRLAEAGCTAHEIQAITGHATLQEVTRYTRAAEQKKLAKEAIKRLAASSKSD